MRSITLLAVFLLGLKAFAAGGFQNGHRIEATTYSGMARAVCRYPDPGSRQVFCDAVDFNPGSHDRFVFDRPVDADKVELVATHEDGSTRKKSVSFDSRKGLSNRVNLTIATLLQRPLLELGQNRISYELKSRRKSVASGSFTMDFELVDEKRCQPATVFVNSQGMCENTSYICSEYFRITNCE